MTRPVFPARFVPRAAFPASLPAAARFRDGIPPEGVLCGLIELSLDRDGSLTTFPIAEVVVSRDGTPSRVDLASLTPPEHAQLQGMAVDMMIYHNNFSSSALLDAVTDLSGDIDDDWDTQALVTLFFFSDGGVLCGDDPEEVIHQLTAFDTDPTAPASAGVMEQITTLLLPCSGAEPSGHERLAALDPARGMTRVFNALLPLPVGPGGEVVPIAPPSSL